MRGRKDRRAFTILEVMMASAIMAFALSSAIIVMQRALSLQDSARNLTLAGQLMQAEFEKMRLKDWSVVGGYAAGPTPVGANSLFTMSAGVGDRFTVQRRVYTPQADMREIELTASWRAYDGRTVSRSMKTYYGRYGLYDYYYNNGDSGAGSTSAGDAGSGGTSGGGGGGKGTDNSGGPGSGKGRGDGKGDDKDDKDTYKGDGRDDDKDDRKDKDKDKEKDKDSDKDRGHGSDKDDRRGHDDDRHLDNDDRSGRRDDDGKKKESGRDDHDSRGKGKSHDDDDDDERDDKDKDKRSDSDGKSEGKVTFRLQEIVRAVVTLVKEAGDRSGNDKDGREDKDGRDNKDDRDGKDGRDGKEGGERDGNDSRRDEGREREHRDRN
ncbi:MAG: type II secretion system protein [Opitutaceae bacterium]|nr:type II secretion system protein [Opitutaceae bacterium]